MERLTTTRVVADDKKRCATGTVLGTGMRRSNNIVKLKEKKDGKSAPVISKPSAPRLLPLKGAADYIGLSVWTLRERVWSGEIPVVRFSGGRKMFIDRGDLDAFIESNKARIE